MEGIKAEQYKPAGKDWAGVRQTLIGTRGETTSFISGILRSLPADSAAVRCINMSMSSSDTRKEYVLRERNTNQFLDTLYQIGRPISCAIYQ
jgi:hypothetical protein